MKKMSMFGELERFRRDIVVACFKVLGTDVLCQARTSVDSNMEVKTNQ
jgi:hypothetical protein